MFVRFVVGTESEHHQSLTGVIAESRLLRDSGALHDYEEQVLADAYRWLNRNLPCPPFSSGNWPQDAVSWFKDDAGEVITRMWELVAILREHDLPVRVLRSRRPGRILYEDAFQAVVVEWNRL